MNIFNEEGELVWSSPRKTLAGADLHGAVLRGGIFNEIDARGVCLRGAKMEGSIWTACRLDDADAIGAEAGGAQFRFCSMVGSNWNASKLVAASFIGSVLDKASFWSADIRFVDFEEAKSTRGAMLGRVDLDKILSEPPEAETTDLAPVGGSDDIGTEADLESLAFVEEEIAKAEQTRLETRDSNVFVAGFPWKQQEGLRAFLKSRGLWREPRKKAVR